MYSSDILAAEHGSMEQDEAEQVPLQNQPWGEQMTYKVVEGRELSLYILKPKDWQITDQRSAVLFFHGGGWRKGSPKAFNRQSKYLAERGVVCLQAEYRLADTRNGEAPVQCIQDAQSAMRWVRTHADELGVDPDKILAGGGSAGGHLAAYLGTLSGMDDPQDDLRVSTRPCGLLLFNPVLHNGPEIGYGYKLFADNFEAFSPFHNVKEGIPPILFMVGTKDPLVPVTMAQAFKQKVESVGGECELVLFPEQSHAFFHAGVNSGANFYRCVVNVDGFLVRHGWLEGEPLYEAVLNGKTFSMEGY